MLKLSKILIISGLMIYMSSYCFFGFSLYQFGIKLNIMYALSMHVSLLLFSCAFYIMRNDPLIRGISVFVAIFCLVSIGGFIYLNILCDKSAFLHKLALICSTVISILYEFISFTIRKHKAVA